MVTEKKRCCVCKNVINYGLHAVKAECSITHKIWYNYTVENNDRNNAEKCKNFNPCDEVWSNSEQKIVKSEDVNWI